MTSTMISGPPQPYRLSAEQYSQMIEAGLFGDSHVELIEGEIIAVNPQGPLHRSKLSIVRNRLAHLYGDDFDVCVQSPVLGTINSTPEPDLSIIRGAPGEPVDRLPAPAEVPLVVEVTHSTHSYDRQKANIYAQAGYSTYWLLDLVQWRIEERSEPKGGVYFNMTIRLPNDEISLPTLGRTVLVRDILGEPPAP